MWYIITNYGSIVKTSEKRPTSLQGPKDLFPMRSLFGGFTVYLKGCTEFLFTMNIRNPEPQTYVAVEPVHPLISYQAKVCCMWLLYLPFPPTSCMYFGAQEDQNHECMVPIKNRLSYYAGEIWIMNWPENQPCKGFRWMWLYYSW